MILLPALVALFGCIEVFVPSEVEGSLTCAYNFTINTVSRCEANPVLSFAKLIFGRLAKSAVQNPANPTWRNFRRGC